MKTPEKRKIIYKIWNISKKKAPIGKRGYRSGEKPCMYHYQKKIEKGGIVWELNPKLWKTRILHQTLKQSPRVLDHKILQPVIDFGSLSTQQKK